MKLFTLSQRRRVLTPHGQWYVFCDCRDTGARVLAWGFMQAMERSE